MEIGSMLLMGWRRLRFITRRFGGRREGTGDEYVRGDDQVGNGRSGKHSGVFRGFIECILYVWYCSGGREDLAYLVLVRI